MTIFLPHLYKILIIKLIILDELNYIVFTSGRFFFVTEIVIFRWQDSNLFQQNIILAKNIKDILKVFTSLFNRKKNPILYVKK